MPQRKHIVLLAVWGLTVVYITTHVWNSDNLPRLPDSDGKDSDLPLYTENYPGNEAFVEELKGFWSAIVEGRPTRNKAEAARRDMALLAGFARHYLARNDHADTAGGLA